MRATHNEGEFELVVVDRMEVAEDVCALTLGRPDGTPLPRWEPGAHIDLILAPGLIRQYSLCGDPDDTGRWKIAVLREEHSCGGSRRVCNDLVQGTTVRVRGPRNLFPLEPAQHYLFIAGGIGITPLVPMIAAVDAQEGDWRLVYGGRTRTSMAFADELVRRYADRVQLGPEDESGQLSVARLMQFEHASTAIYCCGPEGLVSAVESLHARTRRGRLHVERFSPKEFGDTKTNPTFEVEATRSGRVVTVGPDTSVLDALSSAGVPVLSSCTEGICGTCEVAVLDGIPEHRDSILTDEEREASETMFVCVSRCLSPRLVLDI